jgi:hypothetical protein
MRTRTSKSWSEFLKRAGRPNIGPRPSSLLCLDPGETTGWAIFRNGVLTGAGQFRVTSPRVFDKIIDKLRPDALVVENYRIYPWRSKQHQWSEVPTLRYIGMIQYVASARGIPVYFQMAQLAKVFATDRKLKEWNLYKIDNRHANDAIRHGVYFLLFGKTDS